MTTTTAAKKDATIPVRLNLLLRVDPGKWQMPEAPKLDADAVVKALVAGGIPEDAAKEIAAKAAAQPAGNGTAATRTAVREYVLGAVKALDKLTAAGAIVLDADRDATR
jgi:hypothetical protein